MHQRTSLAQSHLQRTDYTSTLLPLSTCPLDTDCWCSRQCPSDTNTRLDTSLPYPTTIPQGSSTLRSGSSTPVRSQLVVAAGLQARGGRASRTHTCRAGCVVRFRGSGSAVVARATQSTVYTIKISNPNTIETRATQWQADATKHNHQHVVCVSPQPNRRRRSSCKSNAHRVYCRRTQTSISAMTNQPARCKAKGGGVSKLSSRAKRARWRGC